MINRAIRPIVVLICLQSIGCEPIGYKLSLDPANATIPQPRFRIEDPSEDTLYYDHVGVVDRANPGREIWWISASSDTAKEHSIVYGVIPPGFRGGEVPPLQTGHRYYLIVAHRPSGKNGRLSFEIEAEGTLRELPQE